MFPNIRAEMARSGMSQEDLAKFLDVSRDKVKHWLNGDTDIPAKALVKMANRWKVSTDYLLGLQKVG